MAYLVVLAVLTEPLLSRPGTYGYRANKFGATVSVSKKDSLTISKINRAIHQAALEKWGEHPPAGVKSPLKDGDTMYSPNTDFAGRYYLAAYGKYRPHIFDCEAEPAMAVDAALNGRRCFVALTFKAYDVKGNIGVACYLKGVLPEKDGAWHNGAVSVEELLKNLGVEPGA